MPQSLLQSQLEALEPLEADELGFELVADRPPSALAAAFISRLGTWTSR
jgi:gluconate kinase